MSPILLVRGDFTTGVPLQIADGYHRVCASYHTDENTDIPVVRIVPVGAGTWSGPGAVLDVIVIEIQADRDRRCGC